MRFNRAGIKWFGIAVVLLLACSSTSFGKSSIEGMVVDFYGQALEGAAIELKGIQLSQGPIRTTSDSNGQYQIKDLDGGSYEMTVMFPGFRREVVLVELFVDEIKRRDVGLEVGKITDVPPIYISGVVQSKGKPLSDVIVTVTNAFNERKSTTARTDRLGRYKIEIFDGGQYVIKAFRAGFEAAIQTKRFDSVFIRKTDSYRVNLSLVRFRGL